MACVASVASGCDWGSTGVMYSGGGTGCPPEECGTNGTRLADERLGALNLDGAPNARGFAIVGFATGGRVDAGARLAVTGGALVAVSSRSGEVIAAGRDLAGAHIALEQVVVGAATAWTLSIEAVGGAAHMSTEPGAIATYRLALARSDEPERRDWLCPDGGAAAVITGERYDAETLAITADVSGGSIRIACEGDLLWKAARMSYDPTRAAGDRYATTAPQRRATLAMLGADYCGTGRRFTEPGTALYWQNRAGWMAIGGAPAATATVEAGWDERGAVCLDAPRLADTYQRGDVEAACGRAIPACTPALLAASEWITWRP